MQELEKKVQAEVEDCVEFADNSPKPVSSPLPSPGRHRAACPQWDAAAVHALRRPADRPSRACVCVSV